MPFSLPFPAGRVPLWSCQKAQIKTRACGLVGVPPSALFWDWHLPGDISQHGGPVWEAVAVSELHPWCWDNLGQISGLSQLVGCRPEAAIAPLPNCQRVGERL